MANRKMSKKASAFKTSLVIISVICLTAASHGISFAQTQGTRPDLATGPGNFTFIDERGNADRPITVWYYRPQKLRKDSPILFVMHGVNRDAQRYCNNWTNYAQEHNCLLLCPEFNATNFPTRSYQLGNMYDESNNPIPESKWTFTTIEHLFDYVRTLTANVSTSYYIYGHSAGAQFVHRLVLFVPRARYRRAIAANAGWYTLPSYSDHKFPYGLRSSNLSESNLATSFGRDFVLLLGEEDLNARDAELRQTKNAEEQGPTRFARGQNFFRAAKTRATELNAPFGWQLQTVPGAHHSDSQMSKAAASMLFAR